MTKKYKKLVRDKIPDMILKEGYIPEMRTLSEGEYLRELDKKLLEEVREYRRSGELEELADIMEVIYAISQARGYTVEQLLKTREEKYEKRGGFSKRIFLESKSRKK